MRRLLKYSLFEYELWLLKDKNKPKLNWEDLTDATIEHILPQTPDADSVWLKNWKSEDINKYTHDISNLVLTKDNSRYKNFDFERKKGNQQSEYCYLKSDIRQERKIAEYDEWTVESCKKNEHTTFSSINESPKYDKSSRLSLGAFCYTVFKQYYKICKGVFVALFPLYNSFLLFKDTKMI
ncbi:MAG: HNH endonuclease [Bacteroidetes bacterium]|nr:HNH endonuclease [Bacteroidota bacterium]